MISFKWKVPKTPIFQSALASDYFRNNRLKVFSMIMPIMQAGVSSRTPVGATGLLRKSFVITYGKQARLTSNLEYASAVNDGRRASAVSMDAKEGIIKWIRFSPRGQKWYRAMWDKYKRANRSTGRTTFRASKKLNTEQAAFLERLAFILMRNKKLHATKGQEFFEKGLKSVGSVINKTYQEILSTIAKGLNP